ncbi:MAG TPA: hypothetical protein VFV23_04915 [Verrucomicrobiae bacterium]|nr:hypothetical protein [Verrucomicrobiae bacterium]
MNKIALIFLACISFCAVADAKKAKPADAPPPAVSNPLAIREIHYAGKLSDDEARFVLTVDAEATDAGAVNLLEGDVAILPAKWPDALKILRDGNHYTLVALRSGHFKFDLTVVAKIQRVEPWNQISFSGPAATIAEISAQAAGSGTDVQLLSGTLLTFSKTNGIARVAGFLGADKTVALRWSRNGGVAAVAHKALLTVDSQIAAQITPTVLKYTSAFHYTIVQGNAAEITLALPASQALTKLDGEQIRDWHLAADGDRQLLTVTFIKPVENSYDLKIYSEQSIESANASASLIPPQPLNVERESGLLTITAEDELVEISTPAGLRQVNAPGNAIAAYEFNSRPLALALKLKPIEPVIAVGDRVTANLEEARLVILHKLALNVEKAGIYTLELTPQNGLAVADVRGDGVEDWNLNDGKIRVNFSARVLGPRQLEVQLEQSLKDFPEKISVAPLRVNGAAKETAQIGAASAPGIQLRTAELNGLREIPVDRLPDRRNEILAYSAEQPDWDLSINSEKLSARVVADIFNLVTIGDGIVGGSATIRYGLVNQGVQEFKVRVPADVKNVDFTGANIRSKDFTNGVWTIGLQDKVWGGYTLVVTYDYQFDAKGATLPVAGIHAENVERETGSIAVTTAASLELNPVAGDTLRRIDEIDLSAADRSFITRPVVLAWQYTGSNYDLTLAAKRFAELPVLEAAADRTQITSVLTAGGEMLSQASFMVKNNDKQFQRFQLPANSVLWSCYVNDQPAKPERDGDWVLVPLPRGTDRDQSFAVDIMYAQTNSALTATFGKNLVLAAPRTDMQSTYAEWQLFVPPTFRLSHFGGNMSVAQGTTYELLDAWEKFLAFYGQVLHEAGGAILFIGLLAFLVIALVVSAVRRGWNGILTLFAVVVILAVLGAMMLPALASAKRKAQRINSVSNLNQIGLALKVYAGDNNNRLPMSFDEMKEELNSEKVTVDPQTGQHYTYLGAGMSLDNLRPDSVLAYSSTDKGHCEVLFADGSVQQLTDGKFAELSQRGLILTAAPQEIAESQRAAIARGALEQSPTAAPATATVVNGTFSGAINPAVSGFSPGVSSISSSTPLAAPAAPPTIAGIHSLRIELPQIGQPFLFTKVLNVRDEPLLIHAHIVPTRTFQALQMVWQSVAFLVGLVIWWTQWRKANRSSFILAIALALMAGSVCSLLVEHRALHDALIVGFPIATLAAISFAIWKYWPRGNQNQDESETPPPIPPAGISSVAAIVLVMTLSMAGARAAGFAAGDPSIVSANYSGDVGDRVASLDGVLKFADVQPGEIVPLFGDDVAVQKFSVTCGKAELIRQGDNLAVRFGRRGDAILQIKMLVKISGDVTKRRLAFAIPTALSSEVNFTLNEAQADVDLPAAVSLKRIVEKDKTGVAAVLGSANQIELLWTPRMKHADEVAATIFCENRSLVAFGNGVENIRATLNYQIAQGELRQARVQLPAGQKLLRVNGSAIRDWEIENENNGQLLVVNFLNGISSSTKLMIETEKNLAALPVNETIAVPHALDVKRETGLIALCGSDDLNLSIASVSGLQRVDAGEFLKAEPGQTNRLASVFQFSKPEFALDVLAAAIQPEIESVVRNNFRVGAGQISLSATIDYTIKRAGIFSLRVELPENYRVENVSGRDIEQQNERDENGRHILEITLKQRTAGDYKLDLELIRDLKELPESLALAGVQPVAVAKLTGFISVSTDAGVAVKSESADGLTEIPAIALPDYAALSGAGGVLAYKFIAPEPEQFAGWKLSVTTENVAAWVRAEIASTFTFNETAVSAQAIVRYDIANAPVKELRVRVPENARNVEISGANIRSREQDGNVWRMELQSPTRGIYLLSVTWDEGRDAKPGKFEIAGISAEGVERETGVIAIAVRQNAAPLQITEADAIDLQRMDAGDFPDWAGAADNSTVLVYRYVRPGYNLALNVRRLNEADVLQALVDSAQFTSVVADDGQMMTEMSLSLRSNGRQFLEIELPPGVSEKDVWSAFVAGQPVRPSVRDGKLLLPVQQSGADDGTMEVQLTYVGTNAFPRARGEVSFASPKFDVPVKNARWEIYLPPDYDYKNFSGTMARETASAPAWGTASFSSLDYSRMEQTKKTEAKAEALRDVNEARRQLAKGNVREANVSFYRAKKVADEIGDKDVAQLQSELQNAQASNLIAAQNDFTVHNWSAGGGGGGNMPVPSLGLRYDNFAAEEQSSKLQQAQEIVTAKVRPLHINLPERGLRLAFSQVLQTETGKSLTVRLFASNQRAVHWPLRIFTIAAAFLVLWGLVAILSRLTWRTKSV